MTQELQELQELNLKQLAEWFDNNCFAFGEVPNYVAEATWKYIYICTNNGVFHHGDMDNCMGFATFKGRFTKAEVLDFIAYLLN